MSFIQSFSNSICCTFGVVLIFAVRIFGRLRAGSEEDAQYGPWELKQTITLDSSMAPLTDSFGFSVYIDGDWLAVGQPSYQKDFNATTFQTGTVWMYRRTGYAEMNFALLSSHAYCCFFFFFL
jgi:hypothetical protein